MRSASTISFRAIAHYLIRVRAVGDQAGPEPVKMAVRIDGKPLKKFDVTAPSGKFQDFQFKQNLRGGAQAARGRFSQRLLSSPMPLIPGSETAT